MKDIQIEDGFSLALHATDNTTPLEQSYDTNIVMRYLFIGGLGIAVSWQMWFSPDANPPGPHLDNKPPIVGGLNQVRDLPELPITLEHQ